jgi:MFS family permease
MVVAVLALGFGLVGIDRFLITTMFPVIARDLSLDYGDIGIITGALAIAWGVAALFVGNLSDRIGRRRILTVSLVAFSLLIGASGLATGLIGLIAVRVVMGIADGAYTPASIAGTLQASAPGRRGFNIGIQRLSSQLPRRLSEATVAADGDGDVGDRPGGRQWVRFCWLRFRTASGANRF